MVPSPNTGSKCWVHPSDLPEDIKLEICNHLNKIAFVKELTKDQRDSLAIAMSIIKNQHIPLLDKYLVRIPEDKKFSRR